MLKVSCNVVVGAGLLGIYDHFLELFLKKIVPQRFQQLLQRPNWLVCKRHFGVHEAEVVAFRRLMRVTEKQVESSPKSKLICFFVYSFIKKRITGKLLRYDQRLYLLEPRKCPQTVQNW